MACFAFVMFLSLICLFLEWIHHPNQWSSSSTINKLLSSKTMEVEQTLTS